MTFHPPAKFTFSGEEMINFLKRLVYIQKKYNMIIRLENMPKSSRLPIFIRFLPYHVDTTYSDKVFNAAKTLDCI